MVQNEKDEREAELARNLRKADLEQIVAKIENDLTVLEKYMEPNDRQAEEHALDMKYLRDRQQRLDLDTGPFPTQFPSLL